MVPATLLYNPAAGRDGKSRVRLVQQVTAALDARGFAVKAEPTEARGSAAGQATLAVRQGSAAIFACGGDGTLHDVLQGVIGMGAILGIIPAGSANALARELRFPLDPVQAARSFHPDRIRQMRTTAVHRTELPTLYSLCMAGAGPDGHLMYRMLAVDRAGLGRWRYYEHALRIFLSHRLAPFRVAIRHCDGSDTEHHVVSAMALRVGELTGIFRGIARGASIHDDSLHVILVAPPARLTLPLWFLSAWLGLTRFYPGVTVTKATALVSRDPISLQVDGEWAGAVPATIMLDGPLQRVLIPQQGAGEHAGVVRCQPLDGAITVDGEESTQTFT